MPTVAEPIWPTQLERRGQIIDDYIVAKPGTIDASDAVLRARLYGNGLRGQDLWAEVRLAQYARIEHQRCPVTAKPCPRGGGCLQCQRRY